MCTAVNVERLVHLLYHEEQGYIKCYQSFSHRPTVIQNNQGSRIAELLTRLPLDQKVQGSAATLWAAVIAVDYTVTYKLVKFISLSTTPSFGWDVKWGSQVNRLWGAGSLNWTLSFFQNNHWHFVLHTCTYYWNNPRWLTHFGEVCKNDWPKKFWVSSLE